MGKFFTDDEMELMDHRGGPVLGGIVTVIYDDSIETDEPLEGELKMAPEQLTRDQLLQQRLWAATNDCSALLKELAALVDQPPKAGSDQEERMRGIEANIDGMRWGCKRLREYKP